MQCTSVCTHAFEQKYANLKRRMFILGPSRASSESNHFFRRDIRKVGFKIAGNGMRYIHGTGNFLMFLFGKREKYEISRDIGTKNSGEI